MVLRLTGDEGEFQFEEVEDDEEDVEREKLKAKGSTCGSNLYASVDNMGGR